jgi:hypothetical protein
VRIVVQRWIAFVCVALLVACSQDDLIQRIASDDEQAFAKHCIQRLRNRDFAYIENLLDPSLSGPDNHAKFVGMADAFPSLSPLSMKIVGAQRTHAIQQETLNLTFEYDFGAMVVLANVAVKSKSGVKTIIGFNVQQMNQTLESRNRFTLTNKGAPQYLILTGAVLAFLISCYALFVCIREKLPGRKWPWILFILIGIGKVSVNWTTGEWFFQVLSIQVMSAGVFGSPFGAWMISCSLPLGALIFLNYNWGRIRPDASAHAPAP